MRQFLPQTDFNDLPPFVKEDKGEFNGSCNRTACQEPGATWYNKYTDNYYCHHCAVLINRNSYADEVLCTEDVRVHSKGFIKNKG